MDPAACYWSGPVALAMHPASSSSCATPMPSHGTTPHATRAPRPSRGLRLVRVAVPAGVEHKDAVAQPSTENRDGRRL